MHQLTLRVLLDSIQPRGTCLTMYVRILTYTRQLHNSVPWLIRVIVKKLLSDREFVETELRKLREDLQAKTDSIQASLDVEVARTGALHSDHVHLLVSENSLKRQL